MRKRRGKKECVTLTEAAAADLCRHCCTKQGVCENKALVAGPKSWPGAGFPPGAPPELAAAGSSPTDLLYCSHSSPDLEISRYKKWGGKHDRSVRSSCGAWGWMGLDGFFQVVMFHLSDLENTASEQNLWHSGTQTCQYPWTFYGCHIYIPQNYHVFKLSHDRLTHHETY